MNIEVIGAMPLGTTRFDDFWGWQFERTGVFSVWSAYRMIVNSKVHRGAWLEGTTTGSDHKQEEKDWTALWKVQVPSKIRVFLCRLAKQSIPTNDVRHQRNMAPDSACTLCGVADSWRHSLLECNMSRSIWALIPERITEHMMKTEEPDAKRWIFAMIKSIKI
jgi:hypothetical protein